MPAGVKDGCFCTGHGCWPPRQNMSKSSKFFMGGKGAVRVGDTWKIHCCTSCHIGFQATGSSRLFIGGKALARIGDSISCGSKNMTGASRLFAGS